MFRISHHSVVYRTFPQAAKVFPAQGLLRCETPKTTVKNNSYYYVHARLEILRARVNFTV